MGRAGAAGAKEARRHPRSGDVQYHCHDYRDLAAAGFAPGAGERATWTTPAPRSVATLRRDVRAAADQVGL